MKKVVTFGELMLRLTPPSFDRFGQSGTFSANFGGSEANVAVSLANYGVDVEFVTRLPKNDIAAACVGELRKYGVGVNNIVYGGERLGIYFLETGAVARPSKVVYDRAHSSISTIEKGMIDWEKVFEGADWFHWTGITPAISQGAADACLEAIRVKSIIGITCFFTVPVQEANACAEINLKLRGQRQDGATNEESATEEIGGIFIFVFATNDTAEILINVDAAVSPAVA
jgi:2-dehydro-3-deoxygluconokinase